MSEEKNKLTLEDLEAVSGGKDRKRVSGLEECPPGTIEIKNMDLKRHHHHLKKCERCNGTELENVHCLIVDFGMYLVEGQRCKCGEIWAVVN